MSVSVPPSRPRLRVLVVEDDPDLCEVFRLVLERDGCSVSVAFDGSSAWDEVRASHFDVVVTDDRMPVMSGVELYRRIRREHDAQMPVVLLTGSPFVPATSDLSGCPLVVLQKPISPGELAARVRALSPLERSNSPRSLRLR